MLESRPEDALVKHVKLLVLLVSYSYYDDRCVKLVNCKCLPGLRARLDLRSMTTFSPFSILNLTDQTRIKSNPNLKDAHFSKL